MLTKKCDSPARRADLDDLATHPFLEGPLKQKTFNFLSLHMNVSFGIASHLQLVLLARPPLLVPVALEGPETQRETLLFIYLQQ